MLSSKVPLSHIQTLEPLYLVLKLDYILSNINLIKENQIKLLLDNCVCVYILVANSWCTRIATEWVAGKERTIIFELE